MDNLVASCSECNIGKGTSGGAELTTEELKNIKYILQELRNWRSIGLQKIEDIIYRGCKMDEEDEGIPSDLRLVIYECVDNFGLLETARVAAMAVAEYIIRDDDGKANPESVELAVNSLYSNLKNRLGE